MEATMTQAPLRPDILGADEDMEISSEAGRGAESDVEIFDLDDDDAATVTNDDEMVDDHEHDVKDEDMNEEEYARENTVDMDDEIVFDEDVDITEVEDTTTTIAQETKDFAIEAPPTDAQDPVVQKSDSVGDVASLADVSNHAADPNAAVSDTIITVEDSLVQEHSTGEPSFGKHSAESPSAQEYAAEEPSMPVAENVTDNTAPATNADHEADDETQESAQATTALTEAVDTTGDATEATPVSASAASGIDPSAAPASTEATEGQADTSTAFLAAAYANGHVAEEHTAVDSPEQDGKIAEPQSQAEATVHESGAEVTLSPTLSHEVRVLYDGNDMSLFRPKDPQDVRTFLLQDGALLHSAVAELFPACRAVLGDSIGTKDELLVEIPDLGLRLCERSSKQPASTLSDVVDVYLALSYNDSSEEPGPLYLHLEVVPDFQSKLDTLHELASDGKGFSSLVELGNSGEDDDWDEIEARPDSAAPAQQDDAGLSGQDAAGPAVQDEVVVEAALPAHAEESAAIAVPDAGESATEIAAGVATEANTAGEEDASDETFELELHAVGEHDTASSTEMAPVANAEGHDDEGDDEEDFIDYSDEEDGGTPVTPVTPSISHKRSWEEQSEAGDEAAAGGELKRAKA